MERATLLELPTGRVRAVLDTDAYNEIDDQFAIVYAMLAPESIELEAIYAAPFLNNRSQSAADGMEKSYDEIQRILELMKSTDCMPIFRGSEAFLADQAEPVLTAAVQDLIERARQRDKGPLYVMAIAAITNVATALLLAPDIIDNIVVLWLGGHADYWPHNREFNFQQDIPAVQALLDSNCALFRVPCVPVADHLQISPYELEYYLSGKGPLAEYLCKIFQDYREHEGAWTKVIWDIAVVAWLVNPDFVPSAVAGMPALRADGTWQQVEGRTEIRSAMQVRRDPIFTDLFTRISRAGL
ncbi:nucleoside hydrolase [Coraliomargarita sp. SDUM461003]|uniref:Nucleoside hydrolase n=1 Tax=Thalassobacterium maritimum TaxID=3041265 RepID=A0ABU1ASZ4_9BACT|nr:nucleoside hydrolase [Coraliomargarita sp. SDUM461003]MDQ8206107.1 nucleoside hydrolase [Coraliomargarita sp. SDUM461003]